VTVPTTIDASGWLSKYLEGADGDTVSIPPFRGGIA